MSNVTKLNGIQNVGTIIESLLKTNVSLLTYEQQYDVIQYALEIIESKYKKGIQVTSPETAADYLRLKLAEREQEVFAVMYLDTQNCLIEYREEFKGTVDSASVYPRVIAQNCLKLNAKSVIISHNHPSGVSDASQSDIKITKDIVKTLELVDAKVLDHIIVTKTGYNSLQRYCN